MIYVVTQQILEESDRYQVISVEESLEMLEPLVVVGLDTETQGFDVYTKELLMLQLGCYDFQVVIDCTTVDVTFYKDYLESHRIFLGWNIKFDYKFLLHKGIILKSLYDGFLAEKLLYNGYPSGVHGMSLKAAGEKYLGVELDKTVRGKIIWSGLSEEVIEYGANDVKYLQRIKEAQHKELEKKGLTKAIQYENKSVPWIAYTEYCGVLVDEVKWRRKMDLDNLKLKVYQDALNEWVIASYKGEEYGYTYLQTEGLSQKDLGSARAKMPGERYPDRDIKGKTRGYFEAYRIPIKVKISKRFVKEELQGDLFSGFSGPICAINWNSSMQVIPLFEELGFDLSVKDDETGGTKKSIEANIIDAQKHISSIAYPYSEYKAAQKVVSTYGENVLVQRNPVSGRVHTNFHSLGTDTGRLSSGGEDKVNKIKYLNFQNFPADPETRACFVANKGYKWISCDYSGQESRILADMTKDPAMLELYNNGCGDVHSLVAKMSFPDVIDCPVEEVKKKFHGLRNDVKSQVEFPINYGGDWNTIMQHSGKPATESKKIYDNYMKGFPGIKAYQDRQRKIVMQLGYIPLNPLTGYKAYIYDYDILMGIKKRFTSEFWDTYRGYKGKESHLPKAVKQELFKRFASGEPFESLRGVYSHTVKKGKKTEVKCVTLTMADVYVHPVRQYFRRKADSEKQSINYPCQHTGAAMFKLAMIYLWDYLCKHDLVFKVKMCIPAHDESNIEVPEDIANEMCEVLKDCMSRAGAFFCRNVSMPADAEVNDFWVH